MEDWNLLEQITGALLSWGAGTALASVVAHLLALLILVAVACVADVVCRHIVLKAVAKVVRHTKAKWDDVVFDHKVKAVSYTHLTLPTKQSV